MSGWRYTLRADGSFDCHSCGSVVHNMEVHDQWHLEQAPEVNR